jgi:hypothetical protein
MVSVLPSEKYTNLLQNSDMFYVIGVGIKGNLLGWTPCSFVETFQRNLLPPSAVQKCSYSEEESRTFL